MSTPLIDMLTREQKDAIADRLEGWELVDFLQIPVQDVIEVFEDAIVAHREDVFDLVGLRDSDFNNDADS